MPLYWLVHWCPLFRVSFIRRSTVSLLALISRDPARFSSPRYTRMVVVLGTYFTVIHLEKIQDEARQASDPWTASGASDKGHFPMHQPTCT